MCLNIFVFVLKFWEHRGRFLSQGVVNCTLTRHDSSLPEKAAHLPLTLGEKSRKDQHNGAERQKIMRMRVCM